MSPGNLTQSELHYIEPTETTINAVLVYISSSIPGQWARDGLMMEKIGGNAVRCESTHLTSFSVLVDVTGSTAVSLSWVSVTSTSLALLLTAE